MSTMKEIARLAGTSTATVSRALSEPQRVSQETLQKVMEAVRLSGYTPNLLARNLRRMESRSIVAIVPDIANPFFPEVIRGIEEVAHRYGYCVLLGETQNSLPRERAYAEMVLSRRADGLIVLSGRIPELLLERTQAQLALVPIVVACEYIEGSNLPTVNIDNSHSAAAATRHLLALGHRRIAFLTGPSGNVLTRDRLAGYRRAITQAGIQPSGDLIVSGDFSIASGIQAAQQLLALVERPSAVVCSNDEMALGAIQWFKQAGLRVPHDISVVGFDDIRFAAVSDPPLTTISQPRTEIGRQAMGMLLCLLNKQPLAQHHVKLSAELVERGSTAPVPEKPVSPSRHRRSALA